MKRPPTYDLHRGGSDIKMTSMIDVVFLLLIFFVWTASFQIVEFVLPSNISAQAGTQGNAMDTLPEQDFEAVVVKLLWDGTSPGWLVNDTPVATFDDVRQTLIQVAEISNEVPVIIDPAAEVPLGHVIDLYDISRLAGFDEVQFAATDVL